MMWDTQCALLEQDVSDLVLPMPNVVIIVHQVGPVKQMFKLQMNSVEV
jgi:hypothetical protein